MNSPIPSLIDQLDQGSDSSSFVSMLFTATKEGKLTKKQFADLMELFATYHSVADQYIFDYKVRKILAKIK